MFDKWNVESYPDVNGPLNDQAHSETKKNALDSTASTTFLLSLRWFGLSKNALQLSLG